MGEKPNERGPECPVPIYLDKYEIVWLLGEGGMGRVFLARQLDLERQVVVKVMHDQVAADPKFRERFRREMLLMARFQHPHAVTLYDDPRGPCIIMEYLLPALTPTTNRSGRAGTRLRLAAVEVFGPLPSWPPGHF